MLSRIREEIGTVSTGLPSDFNRYDELALGMLQLAVDTFASKTGVPLTADRFCTRLIRRHTLAEDRDEIAGDLAATIHTLAIAKIARTDFAYKFAYALLPSLNVMIALDPREFECEPDIDDPLERYTGSF